MRCSLRKAMVCWNKAIDRGACLGAVTTREPGDGGHGGGETGHQAANWGRAHSRGGHAGAG
jgi:hypothetical protein